MAEMPRVTWQAKAVFKALLEADPDTGGYGFDLGQQVGLASGTMHPILTRWAQVGVLESVWEDPASAAGSGPATSPVLPVHRTRRRVRPRGARREAANQEATERRGNVNIGKCDHVAPLYPRFAPDAALIVDAHNGPEEWTGAEWNAYVESAERNRNMVTARLIQCPTPLPLRSEHPSWPDEVWLEVERPDLGSDDVDE